MNDTIIRNIKSLILPKKTDRPGKGHEMDELNIIDDAMVVIDSGEIVYAGAATDGYESEETRDASGMTVLPAVDDPHTHIVHVGSREHEMEMERQGMADL